MKKLLVLLCVCAGFVLSSCSAQLYSSTSNNVAQTKVVLSEKNFKVVGQVEGVATSTIIFGIGGLSQKAVRSNAVAEMFKNANLTGSQTIVNINVKKTIAGFPPFYMKSTFTATGTIVEFTE